MPFDGSGNYTPAASPNFPAIGGTVISSAYYNNVINDIASALSNCLTRDGQGKPSTAFDWNGKNLTNVAAFGAVSGAFSGNVTVGGTLAVTGASTFAAVTSASLSTTGLTAASGNFSGNVTIGGTLDLASPLPVTEGGTGVASATGTGSTVRNISPYLSDVTILASSGEGGQISLNNASDTAVKYILDVDSAGHGRLFTVQNNTNLSLGQLIGTGGLVTLHTAGLERMRIDAAGNVGIGAASTSERLFVSSVSGVQIGASNGTVTQRVGYCLGSAAYSGSATNHPYILLTNDVERVRITTGGTFAVGTDGADFGRAWRFVARNNVAARAEFGFINTDTGAASSVNVSRITGVGNSFCDWELINNSGSPVDSFNYGSAVTAVRWLFNSNNRFQLNADGSISSANRGNAVGFKGVPKSSTTSGTLTTAEIGRCVPATAGITIPNAVFAADDSFSIYNDSAAAITITQAAGLTLRLAGTTSTGNRTLAARGLATIWFNEASEAIISGAGVT